MSDFKKKISGFHVLRFGVGADVRLRCFAMVSEPLPPPDGKEIQVITDELPLQLALSVGATLRTEALLRWPVTQARLAGSRKSSMMRTMRVTD